MGAAGAAAVSTAGALNSIEAEQSVPSRVAETGLCPALGASAWTRSKGTACLPASPCSQVLNQHLANGA